MTDDRPDDQAEIALLLAGLAAETPPLPEDVAARLDDTLAALVAERSATGPGETTPETTPDPAHGDDAGDVVPLPTRDGAQRARGGRPWGPRLLAAATVAAIVGGVGISLHAMSGQTAGSGSGSGSAESAMAHRPGAATSYAAASGEAGSAALPHLSTAHFRRDAARVFARRDALRMSHDAARTPAHSNATTAPAPGQPDGQPTTAARRTRLKALAGGCVLPPVPLAAPGSAAGTTPGSTEHGSTQVVAARVDGRPASLVLRGLGGGRLRVTAWSCTGDSILAAATVHR